MNIERKHLVVRINFNAKACLCKHLVKYMHNMPGHIRKHSVCFYSRIYTYILYSRIYTYVNKNTRKSS